MKKNALIYNQKKLRPGFGAGGWVTMGASHPNHNLLVARCDTYNGYYRDLDDPNSKWEYMLRPGIDVSTDAVTAAIDLAAETPNVGGYGTYCVGVGPDKTMYAMILGQMWRKSPGVDWVKTNLPIQQGTNPNSANRMTGHPMQVDDTNSLHCWFSGENGTYWTIDGFQTFTLIPLATLPACRAEFRSSVCFDRSSATGNGRRDRLYIGVNADNGGVYRITGMASNPPAPVVTKMPNAPENPAALAELNVNPWNGWLYLSGSGSNVDGATLRIYRTDTNVWVLANKALKTVGFDPDTVGRVWGCIENVDLDRSEDHGLTWFLPGDDGAAKTIVGTEVPWVEYAGDKAFIGAGNLFFSASKRLFTTGGVGAWEVINRPLGAISYQTGFVLSNFSKGIENTVGTQIEYSRVQAHLAFSKMDRGHAAVPSGEIGKKFPSKYGTSPPFQFGQGVAFARTNEDFVVGTSAYGERHIGWSSNLGKDWVNENSLIHKYPPHDRNNGDGPRQPAGGGQVIAFSEDCFIAIMLTNGAGLLSTSSGQDLVNAQAERLWNSPHITFDRGKTWDLVPIGNNNCVYNAFAYYITRRTLFHDRFNPTRAYFLNPARQFFGNDPNALADEGIYEFNVDLAAKTLAVVRRRSGQLLPFNYDGYQSNFSQQTASRFYYKGSDDAPGLFKSEDNMATFDEVIGNDSEGLGDRFGRVWSFDVGANGVLYVIGHRRFGAEGPLALEANYGYWKQTAPGQLFQFMGRYPMGMFDRVNSLAAHPWRPDVLALCTKGAGIHQVSEDHVLRLT